MHKRRLFRKIHRWVGLLSALWLLQLTVTGLLLQHANYLGLNRSYVSQNAILQWFNYGHHQQAWESNHQTLYQIDDQVIINGQNTSIEQQLVAAIHNGQQWIVATKSTLYWFNEQGQISQQLDAFDGVPNPIQGLAFYDRNLLIWVNNKHWLMNKQGHWHPTNVTVNITFPSPRSLKVDEQKRLLPIALGQRLSFDKVLYGIHSGLKSSIWLNTLSGFALLYLSLSGIYLFFKPSQRSSQD